MPRTPRVKARPAEPPKSPHCGACHLTLDYLQRRAHNYECSRVECPQRRPLTAAPRQR